MAKVAKSKVGKPAATKSKTAKNQTVSSAAPAVEAPQEAVSAGAKKVSQKLIETIEKRKQARKGYALFSKPAGRRGRRPKGAVEYTPTNQEEDTYVLESEYERIEYDTGIRLKGSGDEAGYSLDRSEEFDEELNFDR